MKVQELVFKAGIDFDEELKKFIKGRDDMVLASLMGFGEEKILGEVMDELMLSKIDTEQERLDQLTSKLSGSGNLKKELTFIIEDGE